MELKSCPFCGSEDEVAIGTRNIHGEVVQAMGACTCGANGPWAETIEEAEEAWNRREGE